MRNTIVVAGVPVLVSGSEVHTWQEGGVRFPAQHMRALETVTEITIHETVTETVAGMVKAFDRAKLGTHFAIEPESAVIRQYADPAYHVLYHAAGHNRQGIGIDIVNPYYPEAAKERAGRHVIEVPWADRGRNGVRDYIVPRLEPLEALWKLISALTSQKGGLRVPLEFPGLQSGKLAMTQVDHGNARVPGVWAHGQQFSLDSNGKRRAHADGFFPLLFVVLRKQGRSSAEAYSAAIELAKGGKWISVAG